MLNLLATLWCIIGIIVGIMVLFLVIVGVCALFAEAVKQSDRKYGRK
jgi:hypothetical protein